MKTIKLFFSSSKIKFGLFLLTFALGVSASAILLFKSDLSRVMPVEIKQTTESSSQIENTFTEQPETTNQTEPAKVVQTEVVDFPINGRVIIESIQKIDKFPQLVFRSEKTGKVLLHSSIKDEYKFLIPEKDYSGPQPEIRFRTINSKGFKSPMIMSVGIFHGGSDNGYYLAIFGEINGKIVRLTDSVMSNAIQGGYYLGYLNKKFGYGLAYWSFIWGDGVEHYGLHHYDLEIYQLKNGKLERVLKKVSRKTYDYNKGFKSFLELGIKVDDQRMKIPEIAETLDLD